MKHCLVVFETVEQKRDFGGFDAYIDVSANVHYHITTGPDMLKGYLKDMVIDIFVLPRRWRNLRESEALLEVARDNGTKILYET